MSVFQGAKVALLVCDVQSSFRAVMPHFPRVLFTCQRMLSAAQLFQWPVIATEQYPKGLGHTVPELDLTGAQLFEKTQFSMMTPPVEEALRQLQLEHVIVVGIESHVCVLQTVQDLRKARYNVHLVSDGIASRHPFEQPIALNQMREMGARLSTSESLLFEWMGDARHPQFKRISQLIKEKEKEFATHEHLYQSLL